MTTDYEKYVSFVGLHMGERRTLRYNVSLRRVTFWRIMYYEISSWLSIIMILKFVILSFSRIICSKTRSRSSKYIEDVCANFTKMTGFFVDWTDGCTYHLDSEILTCHFVKDSEYLINIFNGLSKAIRNAHWWFR